MAKKGYQTPSQAQSEKSRTASYTLALNKVTLQLDVLVKYKKIQMLSQYVTALEVKQMTLDQVQKQAEALRIKDESDVSTKTKIFEQESSAMAKSRWRLRNARFMCLMTVWSFTSYRSRPVAAVGRNSRSSHRANPFVKGRN